MLNLIHWVFEYPLTLIICIVGIIGNFLSILVWKRLEKKLAKPNRNVARLFGILAAVDLCVLVFTILVDVIPAASPSIKYVYEYIIFFIWFGHPLHFYFLFVSIFMAASVSIDRLKLIVYPFYSMRSGRQFFSCAIVLVFGFATVLNIPSFFEYEITHESNSTVMLSKVNYTSNIRLRNIVFVSHCAAGVVVPWLTVLIANSIILFRTYYRTAVDLPKKFKKNRRQSNEHRHMTATLLLLTGTCLLTLSVQCISRCILMFARHDHPFFHSIEAAARFGHIAIPLNSALNIGLFSLPGKQFRKELQGLVSGT